MGQDTKRYVVEVTKLDGGAAYDQYGEALGAAFKLSSAKTRALLKRLPGVATRPVSQREAWAIAEQFRNLGLDTAVHSADEQAAPREVSLSSVSPDELSTGIPAEDDWQVGLPERFRIDLSALERAAAKQDASAPASKDVASRIRRRAPKPVLLIKPFEPKRRLSRQLFSQGLLALLISSGGTLLAAWAALGLGGRQVLSLALYSLIPLLLAAGLIWAVLRSFDRKLRYLSSRAEAVSQGDLAEPLRLEDDSELGSLAASLERLRISTEESLERFRRKR